MDEDVDGGTMLRARAFSLLEMMIVLAVLAVITAIAIPSISEMARRRQESNFAASTGRLLTLAHDTAFKQLTCVEVFVDGARKELVAMQGRCRGGSAPGVQLGAVPIDDQIVKSVLLTHFDEVGAAESHVFFKPDGSIGGSSARLHIDMKSDRDRIQDVMPMIGNVKEVQ